MGIFLKSNSFPVVGQVANLLPIVNRPAAAVDDHRSQSPKRLSTPRRAARPDAAAPLSQRVNIVSWLLGILRTRSRTRTPDRACMMPISTSGASPWPSSYAPVESIKWISSTSRRRSRIWEKVSIASSTAAPRFSSFIYLRRGTSPANTHAPGTRRSGISESRSVACFATIPVCGEPLPELRRACTTTRWTKHRTRAICPRTVSRHRVPFHRGRSLARSSVRAGDDALKPQNLEWFLDEIFAALEQGAVLLTATRRLARVSRFEFTSRQRDRGRSVWKSPLILPLDAYVRRLWDNWLALGSEGWDGVLLTARQEAVVWEQIIRDSPEGASLLQIDATARRAMDAWSLIHEWRLPLDGRYAATEDCAAFLSWTQTFERVRARNRSEERRVGKECRS